MKYLHILFVFFAQLMNAQEIDLSTLQEPYCHVHLMPFNLTGSYLNAKPIETLIKQRNVTCIIEVGSYMGLSTRHMASLLPENGKVYAVDTWDGCVNDYHDPKVIDVLKNGYYSQEIVSILYDQFLSNVIHSGLTNKIIPVRMRSENAASTLQVKPDLIYIDATHTYEAAYQDICAWFPFVQGHGVLCGDDWAWGDGGVGKAATQFAEEHHLQVYVINNWFWYFEE